MSSLKDQLFQQYAHNGLGRLLAEYRKQGLPKKGDRFNLRGITYEIGPPKVSTGTIEFEISSKIPQADLRPEVSLNAYFDEVKERVLRSNDLPVSIDMSNILQGKVGQREEERGYVRLKYRYLEKDLYNDKEISKELKKIQEGHSQISIPSIPEVNTLAAKLVLLFIQERVYKRAKAGMQILIEANEAIRQELCRK